MSIVLASTSATRRQILQNAGLDFEAIPSGFDEEAFKSGHAAMAPAEMAEALAEGKARAASGRRERTLVIGADQVLNCEGTRYGKAGSREEAREQLRKLRGRTHHLETAMCCVRDGEPLWRHLSRPELKMRDFSDGFLERYLREIGDSALSSVGAYQLEGRGVQLFDRIEGDYFAILGLPLLPLLEFLREQGAIAA